MELSLGPQLNRFIMLYGVVPARYSPRSFFAVPPRFTIAPIFVSMFLHGGWLHILGNMLFLFVFGRSIEDRFGHFQFLLLYLTSGVAAAIVQIAVSPASASAHHRSERRHCRRFGRLFYLLPHGPHHNADPAVHHLLDGPTSRNPDSRLLVPHSVPGGIPVAGDSNRYSGRGRMVGTHVAAARLRRAAGPDHAPAAGSEQRFRQRDNGTRVPQPPVAITLGFHLKNSRTQAPPFSSSLSPLFRPFSFLASAPSQLSPPNPEATMSFLRPALQAEATLLICS